jgi:hypothetical protein
MEDIDELENARAVLAGVAEWAKLAGKGVVIGSFCGLNDDGQFMVVLGDTRKPMQALSTIGLAPSDVGAKIVVAFEKGNIRRPIIIGRLQVAAPPPKIAASLKIDGERVVLQAEQQIELRCGEASLVLTRAGKVLIRGNYVLSRSRGANKIKGAFVDIN